MPATNRFNAGLNFMNQRFLGSLSVNYSDEVFWTDVLNSQFHGATDSYTLVNAQLRREVGGRQGVDDHQGH